MVGQDYGGRFISVPIEPTREVGVWYPVTAWPSKTAEIVHAEKASGYDAKQESK